MPHTRASASASTAQAADQKANDEAVFKSSFIPRNLNEVYDPERDIAKLKSGQGEGLIYAGNVTGLEEAVKSKGEDAKEATGPNGGAPAARIDDDESSVLAVLNDTNVLFLPTSDYALEYDGLRIEEGQDHSTLSIDRRIDDPMATEIIKETPGSARDMLLAYQPKDIKIELTLAVHEDQSFSFEVTILVTVSRKITLGGLCEVLNLLWACMPAPEIMKEVGGVVDLEVKLEYFRGKARELGSGAMKWMKGDGDHFERGVWA